ncbi:unnamed protein product [Colias eurytheme]|nr:unnamed protein product [Colias eurytheme]
MDMQPTLTPVEKFDQSPVIDRCVNFNYAWLAFRGCMNTLVQSLIAVCVFVTSWFALQSSLNPFYLHVLLCVIGYQFLITHGVLSLYSYNGWSASLSFRNRRRCHWILQTVGSLLAIVGSIVMMREKKTNFTSIHGKLALAALILTCFGLLNGVMSLYKATFQRFVAFDTLKSSHLLCGTAALTTSSVCLAFGFNKDSFKNWSSPYFSYVMMAIVFTYTIVIISKPCYDLWRFIKIRKTKRW